MKCRLVELLIKGVRRDRKEAAAAEPLVGDLVVYDCGRSGRTTRHGPHRRRGGHLLRVGSDQFTVASDDGLALGELPGEEVGVVDEVEKIRSSRSR